MSFLFNSDGYMKISGYAWRTDEKGSCFKKNPYRSICGYEGPSSKCISKLTNHACKHLVNSMSDRDAILRRELMGDGVQENGNYQIDVLEDAKTTEEKNDAIVIYKMISEGSLDSVDYAVVSKGNMLLHCTEKYQGLMTVLGSKGRQILSFYPEKSFSAENYCFYKLIERICWNDDHKCYAIPDKLPDWIDTQLLAYEGSKWLKSATNGCLGMNDRIMDAFTERVNIKDDISEELRSILFHYHYNYKNQNDIRILKWSKKVGTVNSKRGVLLEMLLAYFFLGESGIEYLDDEEKMYSEVYGKNAQMNDLFTGEEWAFFDKNLYYWLYNDKITRCIEGYSSFQLSEDLHESAPFIADSMAQSLAMDVFTLKLLKLYSEDYGCDFGDIDKIMDSDSALKQWNDFYTFLLGINWIPTVSEIKDVIEDLSEIDNMIEDELADQFDVGEGASVHCDYIGDDFRIVKYDNKSKRITVSVTASFTAVAKYWEGDEFDGGLVDSCVNSDGTAEVIIEIVVEGQAYREDIEVEDITITKVEWPGFDEEWELDDNQY